MVLNLVMCVCGLLFLYIGNAQDTIVPAIITFGDSIVDVGNNNYLSTLFRADKPPYGRDFVNHQPTGRFCNGKLATDFVAGTLGFKSYAPAYLSPEASGKTLLIGANFASAGSGYYDKTATQNHAIPLSQQLKYYKEYQSKLAEVAGQSKAKSIMKDALYVLTTGTTDFIQNYYTNSYLRKTYTVEQYSSMLISLMKNFTENLYDLGARKIGVTSLPPLGCIPLERTLAGTHESGCVSQLNTDAQGFNKMLNNAATSLKKKCPDLRLVIFDIYKPVYDLVNSPSMYGFAEAGRGCCGTGTVELTTALCNSHSLGTCSNATQYVFFDSAHTSEAANKVIADEMINQGLSII
ncbi:GDSL esterase/lipase APG [Cannabis sativa]|uniref:GDSL esterase/lipase APG n=1 Tax=Cannabis sativa TaxID=3483 RepID=A0A7J6EUN6_CANSA|nr:GDSL esterase/lipase APG [Cannabis sativa]KAF4362121.1 hypothetical protein F8388_023973 [Cannabis sativa]